MYHYHHHHHLCLLINNTYFRHTSLFVAQYRHFDADWRAAKRLTRRLERAYLAACHHAFTASCSPTVAEMSAAAEVARQS